MAWTVGCARAPGDLRQILALQRENLRGNVSADEAREQGFVTVAHRLDTLQAMHSSAPSIVAKQGDELIGYALSMPIEARHSVPLLEPMFQQLSDLEIAGLRLTALRYYVMGQVCVAKAFRGQGVFDALYQGHKAEYQARFELLVTEVSVRNARSLRAHERVGFEPLHRYTDDVDEWLIMGWDWR